MKTSKRILRIVIKRMTDPDTSWLGEYAARPTSEYSIDRAHALDCRVNLESLDDVEDHCDCLTKWRGRELRYFNPSFNYVDEAGQALPENTPEEVRKYVKQDYERMEALNSGQWNFIGILAEAEVTVGDTYQAITSGGLWGVESDSDAAYLKDIEQEELSSLRGQLEALGFSKRAISTAFKNVQAYGRLLT